MKVEQQTYHSLKKIECYLTETNKVEEPVIKKFDITPSHFTLTKGDVSLDVAFDINRGDWRVSYNGTTYIFRSHREEAEEDAISLIEKIGRITWIEKDNGDMVSVPRVMPFDSNNGKIFAEVKSQQVPGETRKTYDFCLVTETADGKFVQRVHGDHVLSGYFKGRCETKIAAISKAAIALICSP